ncbi:MAG: DNA polymerase III subunit epsilon [Proteobacteria bacterium]|jgi:DNA polymerase III subunit epsilon|nr:DNA polymerase III subunit epsilon [Pseudomonadota bacterium]
MKEGVRYVCLDTETTGTLVRKGHRILEIGCVEVIDGVITGNEYHTFLNPECEIDKEAIAVHGITQETVKNEPKFEKIAGDFQSFIENSVLVIHNASFDISFLNNELDLANLHKIENEVIDTLILARKKYVGERASLDALCTKFAVDRASRTLHGALLDAKLLAEVFLQLDKETEIHGKVLKYIMDNNSTRNNYSHLQFVSLA